MIKEKLSQLNTQYAQLSQREKLMVLLSGVVLVLFVGFFHFVEPSWLKAESLDKNNRAIVSELANLKAEKQAYHEHLSVDPNDALHAKKKKQVAVLAQLEQALDQQVVDLVKPQNMPEVVHSLLQQMEGLEVLDFQTNQPTALLPAQQDHSANLFRHSLSLTLLGSYQNLYKFLANAEMLPWQFHWQNFNLTVKEFPQAELQIEIYTLSLEQGFIGL